MHEVNQEPVLLPSFAVSVQRMDLSESVPIIVVMHDILILGRNVNITHVAFPNEFSVSSQHCRLIYKNEQMYLEDLHSTNGTYINGKRLDQKVLVQSGVKVNLGGVLLQIFWKEINPSNEDQ